MGRFGVLGTGTVGQTLASKLVSLGHDVMMGSRQSGNEKAVEWAKAGADLGDLGAARGMEMYLPLWLRLFGAAGSPRLNVKVVVGT